MIIDRDEFMKMDIQKSIEQIESDHTKKINQLVIEQIDEEKNAYHDALKTIELKTLQSKYEIRSNNFIAFLGSWKFIFIIIGAHLVWILMNINPITNSIDPFPFNKLYFGLSFISLIQGPLIMLSQNRSKLADEQRQQNEYLINLKNEVDINNLHKKIDLVIYDQIETLIETQKIQFDYLDKIEKKLGI